MTEIVVGPGGRYAYIFSNASPSGEVYTIDQQTGALTATGVTIPGLSTGGYDLTFDPSGRYLIGTVLAPGDTEIVSYTQNPIDGSLSLNTVLSLSDVAEWIGITP